MKTAVLFRFHENDAVCIQNLSLFKRLNPGLPIYGLYGGAGPISAVSPGLLSLMEDCWAIPIDDPFYKWKNADACIRLWFLDRGYQFSFDHLFLLEWDAVFLKPIDQMFLRFEMDKNYGAIVRQNYESAQKDWIWVRDYGREIEFFLGYLRSQCGRDVDISTCKFSIMLGFCFARGFIEEMSKISIPTGSNDEFRLGVLSSFLEYPLCDNGIFQNEKNFVRTRGYQDIGPDQIRGAIESGAFCIHPVRHIIPEKWFDLA